MEGLTYLGYKGTAFIPPEEGREAKRKELAIVQLTEFTPPIQTLKHILICISEG